jgi:hypothetical protein
MGAALAAMLSVATMSGCDDDVETVLTGNQCEEACDRYAACFDNTFNTDLCTNNCEAAVNNNTIAVATTDDCLNCIGAAVCGAPTYACANVCNSIIVIQ